MSNFASQIQQTCAYTFDMDDRLRAIKTMIYNGETTEAIAALNEVINRNAQTGDMPFYLLGNAYRKMGDWQHAIDNYMEAMDRNPDSPAASAHASLMDILNFYNKDMYNQ